MIEFFQNLVSHPFDPERRFFFGAVLGSLLLGYILLLFSIGKRSTDEIFKSKIFSFKIWLHPSSLNDFKIFLFNSVIRVLWAAFFVSAGFKLSVFFLKSFRELFPSFDGVSAGTTVSLLIYTFFFFVLDDFCRFFHHWLMHRVGILKIFHRTHHSATVLTPLTLHRAHFIEVFMAEGRNALVHAITLSLSAFLFPFEVSAIDILGVNAFGILFNILGANLRHSEIPISFGRLEYIFISPRMHQIHHSNQPFHFEKNYGVSLSLWDQVCGSFYRPTEKELSDIEYGLGKFSKADEVSSLWGALVTPFKLLTGEQKR